MRQNKGMRVEQDWFGDSAVLNSSSDFKVHGVLVTIGWGITWVRTQRIKPHLLVTEEERLKSIGTQLSLL
jgi:hypothetical protein